MKRANFLYLLLLPALIATGIFWDQKIHPTPPAGHEACLPEETIRIPATTAAPSAPTLHAKYACVMDGNSERVLYGKDASAKVPMASTTKIMTAILVLESGRIDEQVTATSYAASMPKVRLGMCKGYQYRLKDLLYSLMLESHNDSAVAIAEHMAGSVQGFAVLMNEKAAKLGMADTHFVTPNGLDADGHYSTAADMCRLAAYAIRNREFCSLVQTKSYRFRTLDGRHSYAVSNKDAFLSYYDGALGIKTGFTGKAGFCFVGAAMRDDVLLTSCVLASGWPPNKSYKWTDTRNLMDYGFDHFAPLVLPVQDLTAVRIPVEDGRTSEHGDGAFVSCQQPGTIRTLFGRFESITVTYDLPDKLYAPVRADNPVGTISFYIGSQLYARENIFPSENIEKSDFSDTIRTVLRMAAF